MILFISIYIYKKKELLEHRPDVLRSGLVVQVFCGKSEEKQSECEKQGDLRNHSTDPPITSHPVCRRCSVSLRAAGFFFSTTTGLPARRCVLNY